MSKDYQYEPLSSVEPQCDGANALKQCQKWRHLWRAINLIMTGFFLLATFVQVSEGMFLIAMICVTKSRTGNYDFRACARARVSPVVQGSVGHIRFAVCAERSRDNILGFLRKFHPDKIWNTLSTIPYLSTQVIQIPSKSKTSFSSSFIL